MSTKVKVNKDGYIMLNLNGLGFKKVSKHGKPIKIHNYKND